MLINKFGTFLQKPRSFYSLVFFTFCLILVFLFFILPLNFSWLRYQNVAGDLAQHLSGWYAFFHVPWYFPLLKITSLNYPQGGTISLTDSIPLFALFFKLIRNLLPPEFNYFGIFLIFVYLTQGFSALTLAYAVNRNNILTVLALVILALSAPIVSYRLGGEDSLACQSFILLGLSGYFFVHTHKLHLYGCQVWFGLLLILSLIVHPYLTMMTYPFYLISILKIKQNDGLRWRVLWAPALAMHAFIVLEFVVLGLGRGVQGFDDFGVCSMNLLAPFYGGWFTHNAVMAAYPAQGEGFAYLGLGLMGLLLLSFLLNWGRWKNKYKQHRSLMWVGIVFFILAIYGHIFIGPHKIIVYGVPRFFFTYDFRANGRFFWPSWYILMTIAVLGVSSRKSASIIILSLILLGLQLFDVSGYAKILNQKLSIAFMPVAVIDPSTIQVQALMRQSKLVVFYPKMACSTMHEVDAKLLAATQLFAAKVGVPINTAYFAHFKSPACGDDANIFPLLSPKLLVANINNPSPTILKLLKVSPNLCHTINQAYYCEYPS